MQPVYMQSVLRRFRLRPDHQKSRGMLRGLLQVAFFLVSSVAIVADPRAYAGSAEADTTAIIIAAVLDVTRTRSVSV
jgi:hypothetical protein